MRIHTLPVIPTSLLPRSYPKIVPSSSFTSSITIDIFSSQSSRGGFVKAPFLSDNDKDVVDNDLDLDGDFEGGDILDGELIIL